MNSRTKVKIQKTVFILTCGSLFAFTILNIVDHRKSKDIKASDSVAAAFKAQVKQTQTALKNRITELEKQLASRPATCPKCPESEPVPHSCPPDPMSGDCAVSWVRLLSGKRVGSVNVACGDGWTIRWKRTRQPNNP